ncbi:MAG: DUF6378 domain-containing protein [Cellvibrionaceae bacterium]
MIIKRCMNCKHEWSSKLEQCPKCLRTDYEVCGVRINSDSVRLAQTTGSSSTTAASILRKGAGHIEDRAASRDCAESGERSMSKTVKAFNALYGHELTEEQGWQFMCILKKARASQGGYNADDYEDDAAYAALAGECAGAQA